MNRIFINTTATLMLIIWTFFGSPSALGAKKIEKFYWHRTFIIDHYPANIFSKLLSKYGDFTVTSRKLVIMTEENKNLYFELATYECKLLGKAHELFFIKIEKENGQFIVKDINLIATVVFQLRLSWYKSPESRYFYEKVIAKSSASQ